MPSKPESIAKNESMSRKWDEICANRDFKESDAPTIALLCGWHAVIDRCMSDISGPGGVTVSYENDIGDKKALPQLATMKQASAEVRALNKQLGIFDEARGDGGGGVTVLEVIRGRNDDRARGAGA